MQTVILAGGKGTRFKEETILKPKPLIKVGNIPIIQQVMRIYQQYGFNDFLILTGYKSDMLFECFSNNAIILNKNNDRLQIKTDTYSATLLNTGENTGSAQRLYKAKDYIKEDTFMLTYCDGLCSVNLHELLHFHNKKQALVTITAVKPTPRFGVIRFNEEGIITEMHEKALKDVNYISGGYMVCNKTIFDYYTKTTQSLEKDLLEKLVSTGKMRAYLHTGFWQCMDTLYEKEMLDLLCQNNELPWLKEVCNDNT